MPQHITSINDDELDSFSEKVYDSICDLLEAIISELKAKMLPFTDEDCYWISKGIDIHLNGIIHCGAHKELERLMTEHDYANKLTILQQYLDNFLLCFEAFGKTIIKPHLTTVEINALLETFIEHAFDQDILQHLIGDLVDDIEKDFFDTQKA
jgi:hypothetical protein